MLIILAISSAVRDPDRVRIVAMFSIEVRTVVMRQGYEHWVPDVICIDSTNCVELDSRTPIRRFFMKTRTNGQGDPITRDNIVAAFSVLREARNAAVDEILLQDLNKESDDALDALPVGFKRLHVDVSRFPQIVSVPVKPISGVDVVAIPMQFETHWKKTPAFGCRWRC